MRAVGLWIAAAVDDRELAVVEKLLERLEARVERQRIVELVQPVLQADDGTGFEIRVALVGGDDGVEAVVSAGKLDHDEDVVVADLRVRDGVGESELGHEGGHGPAEGGQ